MKFIVFTVLILGSGSLHAQSEDTFRYGDTFTVVTTLNRSNGDDRVFFQDGKTTTFEGLRISDNADCVLRNLQGNKDTTSILAGTKLGVINFFPNVVQLISTDLTKHYALICVRGLNDNSPYLTPAQIQKVLGNTVRINRK